MYPIHYDVQSSCAGDIYRALVEAQKRAFSVCGYWWVCAGAFKLHRELDWGEVELYPLNKGKMECVVNAGRDTVSKKLNVFDYFFTFSLKSLFLCDTMGGEVVIKR